jgi:hypothetical protein
MKALVLACTLQTAIVFSATDSHLTTVAKYPFPWGKVIVSFDPVRVAKTELDRWMRLSPHLSSYNDLLGIDVRRCIPMDDEYVGCEKGGKLRIENVDLNIRKMLAIKKELDNEKLPSGLRPVVSYFSERQNFALWTAKRQREFLATGNVSALEQRYDGISNIQKCAQVVRNIAHTSHERDRDDLVTVDWANCVLFLEKEKIGEYPKTEWQAFLRAQGITEVVKDELPND